MRFWAGSFKAACVSVLAIFLTAAICPEGIAARGNGDIAVPSPRVLLLTERYGYPSAEFEWNFGEGAFAHNELQIAALSPVPFTGLSVGWTVDAGPADSDEFEVHIRTRREGEDFCEWLIFHGADDPEDVPGGVCWAGLFITPGDGAHDEFEVELIPPGSVVLSSVLVSVADASLPDDGSTGAEIDAVQPRAQTTGGTPAVITREQWWGSLPYNELCSPRWSPKEITVTHSVLHHTVTPNNPPDPYQTIRSIWIYHANTRGWGDIGYNFLIDQYGNIYQGRYNPWWATVDMEAGHAYAANTASFGVSLLGQFHPPCTNPAPGQPSAAAINAYERICAWRFAGLGLNPLESAPINTGAPGEWMIMTVPRICGHRDVIRPGCTGVTSCPGDTLYACLPSIRQNVAGMIIPDPPPLVESVISGNWDGGEQSFIGRHETRNSTFSLWSANSPSADINCYRYGSRDSGWLPVAGDWNGDGTTTVGLFDPAKGIFYLRNSNTAGVADYTFRYGPVNSGWLPVAGDWNGDGTATVGLFDPAKGIFYLRNSNTAGVADYTFRYGPVNSGWLPVAGDWNGDGSCTIGLFDPVKGLFYLRDSNSGGVADCTFRYGPAGSCWLPFAGDWDGDGVSTIGLFDLDREMALLRNSNCAGVADLSFKASK